MSRTRMSVRDQGYKQYRPGRKLKNCTCDALHAPICLHPKLFVQGMFSQLATLQLMHVTAHTETAVATAAGLTDNCFAPAIAP